MAVRYVPVQWGFNKYWYDAVLVLAVVLYVVAFIQIGTPDAGHARPVDGAILRIRAFGTCAFLMLTVILCIGPLARLDRRFLPLLYNRRHFGVLTSLVALTHADHVIGWYFAFSPTPRYQALLDSNTSFDVLLGFPFELFGVFALLVLFVLAATSHDFWLHFLTAPVWKRLHLLIYPAYIALILHVGLGYFQDATNSMVAPLFFVAGLTVAGLHVLAWRRTRRGLASPAERPDPQRPDQHQPDPYWLDAGPVSAVPDGRAVIVRIDGDEHAAVFRDGHRLAAVSNVCAHQNGPLGEGRVIDGCATCPWHGFQYRLEDGCSPPPFTEKVPTYRLRLAGDRIQIARRANPLGTPVQRLTIPAEVEA